MKYALKLLIPILAIFLCGSFALADSTYEIRVKVDGLACPFCAYGLEKRLVGLDGLSNLKIFVDDGYATFQYPYGKIPDLDEISSRVKKGGFTAKETTVSIPGTVTSLQGKKLLSMNGVGQSFLLEGNLDGIIEGQKIEVQGKLKKVKHKGHKEHPLSIEVASWKKQ